ncbi:MAG: zinc transporter [Porticoccaceae bacterium]
MNNSTTAVNVYAEENESLICGFQVNNAGVVETLNWEQAVVNQLTDSTGLRWVHLNRESVDVQEWLTNNDQLDSLIVGALLQADTRPRIVKHHDGYLLNLRGVNLNPGENAEDMVSLRLWVTAKLVISTRARRVLAIEDLEERFLSGEPPSSTGELIAFIAQRLVSRIAPVVAELDDKVDTLEERLLDGERGTNKALIGQFRRTVLSLRRYIAPQREALAGFLRDNNGFLTLDEQHQLRDTHDSIIRVAEDLDLIRERALLLQEHLVEERAEAMNARLFVLAIISAIFLPLGFVTGLFGVNVGGMPGVEHPSAFAFLCLFMAIFSVAIVVIFRWKKWI